MPFETVIGLEIHAQIATRTKMFCSCDNDTFAAEPNSAICPICTAQPGALPVPNEQAVKLGITAALALGCTIAPHSKFDRKNYFYPDLPMGYQISQFDEPLGAGGAVEIVVDGAQQRIGITRLHLENDAGKLTHVGQSSLVDFNRAGTPLMEIVSEPDLRSASAAKAYAEAVTQIVQFVGASNADMFKGELRFDASVSLRPVGDSQLYPRAEIKNLNSFRALETAINFEIARQTKLWEAGTAPATDQTVGWDDEKGETYLMREKESAADYRYFPEPDIPPLAFDASELEQIRSSLPELPLARRARLVRELGVSEADAATLTSSRELADFFEQVVATSGDAKKSIGWVLTELGGAMKEHGVSKLAEQKITAVNLGKLVKMICTNAISGKIAKEIFPELYATGADPEQLIADKGLAQVSDLGALEKLVDEALAANPKVVEDFKSGKGNALGFIVGQVMKASRGQANPAMVNEIIKKKVG